MKVAVAYPPYPSSLVEGLQIVNQFIKEAAELKAAIICFPESYLPGYPVEDRRPEKCSADQLQKALNEVCEMAAKNKIAVVIPMDWRENGKYLNVAQVISKTGERLGYQTKNQLDPSEDTIWQPGSGRKLFEVDGLKFGVVICHEGFRYPESVRWAARQGAKIVFHPNLTGSEKKGKMPKEWGAKENYYYEKAQMVRAMENTIYFAPSNYFLKYPESASSVISPDGTCLAFQEYGKPGIAIAEIDPGKATGLLAKRFKPEVY